MHARLYMLIVDQLSLNTCLNHSGGCAPAVPEP